MAEHLAMGGCVYWFAPQRTVPLVPPSWVHTPPHNDRFIAVFSQATERPQAYVTPERLAIAAQWDVDIEQTFPARLERSIRHTLTAVTDRNTDEVALAVRAVAQIPAELRAWLCRHLSLRSEAMQTITTCTAGIFPDRPFLIHTDTNLSWTTPPDRDSPWRPHWQASPWPRSVLLSIQQTDDTARYVGISEDASTIGTVIQKAISTATSGTRCVLVISPHTSAQLTHRHIQQLSLRQRPYAHIHEIAYFPAGQLPWGNAAGYPNPKAEKLSGTRRQKPKLSHMWYIDPDNVLHPPSDGEAGPMRRHHHIASAAAVTILCFDPPFLNTTIPIRPTLTIEAAYELADVFAGIAIPARLDGRTSREATCHVDYGRRHLLALHSQPLGAPTTTSHRLDPCEAWRHCHWQPIQAKTINPPQPAIAPQLPDELRNLRSRPLPLPDGIVPRGLTAFLKQNGYRGAEARSAAATTIALACECVTWADQTVAHMVERHLHDIGFPTATNHATQQCPLCGNECSKLLILGRTDGPAAAALVDQFRDLSLNKAKALHVSQAAKKDLSQIYNIGFATSTVPVCFQCATPAIIQKRAHAAGIQNTTIHQRQVLLDAERRAITCGTAISFPMPASGSSELSRTQRHPMNPIVMEASKRAHLKPIKVQDLYYTSIEHNAAQLKAIYVGPSETHRQRKNSQWPISVWARDIKAEEPPHLDLKRLLEIPIDDYMKGLANTTRPPRTAGRPAPDQPRVNTDPTIVIANLSDHSVGIEEYGYLNVKVDRTTALGNPWPLPRDETPDDRDCACVACDVLMATTNETATTLLRIAENCHLPPDLRFDTRKRTRQTTASVAARRQGLQDLAKLVHDGHRLRLLCHCKGRRCHAASIARRVLILAGLPHEAAQTQERYTHQWPELQPRALAQRAAHITKGLVPDPSQLTPKPPIGAGPHVTTPQPQTPPTPLTTTPPQPPTVTQATGAPPPPIPRNLTNRRANRRHDRKRKHPTIDPSPSTPPKQHRYDAQYLHPSSNPPPSKNDLGPYRHRYSQL